MTFARFWVESETLPGGRNVRPHMLLRPILPLIALVTVAGACGSSADDAIPSDPSITDSSVATDPPIDVPVTFESSPIQAGPIFGSGSSTSAGETDTASQAEPCVDCEPGDDREPTPRSPSFAPAAADEPFCTLLSELEERPFPSDETEAIAVVRAWISELRDAAVDSIVDDLDVFLDFLDEAINSQGQIGLGDSGPEIETASDRMDEYVETKCFGRSGASTDQ